MCGSLDGHQRFVVNGKLAPKTIEGILKRYADNYVIYDYCKNPNTILTKEDNKLRVNCEKAILQSLTNETKDAAKDEIDELQQSLVKGPYIQFSVISFLPATTY
ncbi:eukaryotic translation initiation factor 2 subunit beta [Tanacetum coccineum]